MRQLALAATVSMTLLLVACSAAGGGGDVINLGGGSGELCASVAPGGSFVVGEVVSLARGDSPVTIKEVSLVEMAGVKLVGAYSVPFAADGTGIMSMGLDHPAEVWEQREPAEGSLIAKAPTNVLLELRRTGDAEGHARAVEITYATEDGSLLTQRGSTAIVFRDRCF